MSGEKKLVPRRRFKEFQNDTVWKNVKFLEILDNNNGIRRGPFGSALKKEFFVKKSKYVVYEQQNAIYNNFKTRYNITKEKYNELDKFTLSGGDFIISGAGTIGRIARVPYDIKPGVFNQALVRLRINDNTMNSDYFLQWIRSDNMQNRFTKSNPGSAMSNLVPMSEVKKWSVVIPTKNEQTKIGIFFKKLDDAIALQEKKINKTQAIKEAYLAEMFPVEGERVPKRRFVGFIDDWKTCKLNEIITRDIKGKAKANLIGGNNLYLDANRLNGGKSFFVSSPQNVSKQDIIILWDGSQAGTVYYGFTGALGSTLKAYSTNQDSSFIFQQLVSKQTMIYEKYRTPNIPHVVKTFTQDFIISVPDTNEQKKIGEFFKKIDDNITLQQQKLKKLQDIKKAYLNEMFV